MVATVIPTRFRLRRDTAANWAATNPIPLDGEPCLETDTGLRKLGDGVTQWNALLYQLSGAAYDFAHLADGDTPIWDAANRRWKHGPGGKIYQPGTGIEITNPDTSTPTISSTLGSIALSGRKEDYAHLPTGLGTADAGKAYYVESDKLIYVWNGDAFPTPGAGIAISAGAADQLSVVSLTHFDGTAGSTTYTEEYGNSWTTVRGGGYLDTAKNKWGASSWYGGNGQIQLAGESVPADDWMIDLWFYAGGHNGGHILEVASDAYTVFQSDANVAVYWNGGLGSIGAYVPDAWNSLRLLRTNGVTQFGLNGTFTLATTRSISGALRLGASGNSSWYFNGWIDEVALKRIVLASIYDATTAPYPDPAQT